MGLRNISDLVAPALSSSPSLHPQSFWQGFRGSQAIGRVAVAAAQGTEHIKALMSSCPNSRQPRLWGRWKWELIVDLELSVYA